MFNKQFLFPFIIFYTPLSGCERTKMDQNYSDFYLKYLNQIQKSASDLLEKKYRMHCYGSGGGAPYFINLISLCFEAPYSTSITEARKLIVNMTEDFVQVINNHEKARPYLVGYPFPIDNIDISLNFIDPKKNKPETNFVFIKESKIIYSLDEPLIPIKKVFDESYEDAYKLVKGHPRPENLKPGPLKSPPVLNRDGTIAKPAVLDNDPNNPWPKVPS